MLKRFNIDHFLRSRIVLYAEFFYFSGQNGASNMFAQHHDVLSRISKISTNHFFNFNINCCVFVLKKVNYAIFFEVVLIIFSVSF